MQSMRFYRISLLLELVDVRWLLDMDHPKWFSDVDYPKRLEFERSKINFECI